MEQICFKKAPPSANAELFFLSSANAEFFLGGAKKNLSAVGLELGSSSLLAAALPTTPPRLSYQVRCLEGILKKKNVFFRVRG